jgi:preprotein translocase subunit SecB
MSDIRITFKTLLITEVHHTLFSEESNISEKGLTTEMQFGSHLDSSNTKRFRVNFDLTLKEDGHFMSTIKAIALFETSEEVNEEFVTSPFFKANAPAIAYPYLRAFISTFTLNSGIDPIILPTFNFLRAVKQAENELRKQDEDRNKEVD